MKLSSTRSLRSLSFLGAMAWLAACSSSSSNGSPGSSGGAGGSSAQGSCAELLSCCASFADPANKQSCLGTAQQLSTMPNGEAECTQVVKSYQAAGACSAPATGGCAGLLSCCTGLKDPATQQACLATASSYAKMAGGDTTCAQVQQSYQSAGLCGASAGPGGPGAGGNGAGGQSGSGCAGLLSCCVSIKDSGTQQTCFTTAGTYTKLAGGDATCAQVQQSYQAAGLCGGNGVGPGAGGTGAAGQGAGGQGGGSGGPICSALKGCCQGIADSGPRNACLMGEAQYAQSASGESSCKALLQSYEQAGLCGVGPGGNPQGTGGNPQGTGGNPQGTGGNPQGTGGSFGFGGGGTSAQGGTSSGAMCGYAYNRPSCESCVESSGCCDASLSCQQDPSCAPIEKCVASCPLSVSDCLTYCYDKYPQSENAFLPLAQCLQGSGCSAPCALGSAGAGQGGAGQGGTSQGGSSGGAGSPGGGSGSGGTSGGLTCGQVNGQIGCCADDGNVYFCTSSGVQSTACPAGTCGWNATNSYYDCGTTGGADPTGTNPKACGASTGVGGASGGSSACLPSNSTCSTGSQCCSGSCSPFSTCT